MATQSPTAPFDTGHYNRCIEKLDEFFWVFDLEHYRFVYIGAGYARIWERSRQPLYENASPFFEGVHPADRGRILEAFCGGGAGTYNESYKVCRPDGTVRWIRDRAFPLLGDDHRPGHVAGLATDLTDLIKGDPGAEETVAAPDTRPTLRMDRTQQKFQRLFRESADAAVLFDVHGYIIEANERAGELLGFGDHEMVRMHFASFFPSETLAKAVEHWDKITSGQSMRFSLPVLRKNGERLSAECAAALIDFGPEYIVQVNLRDITPRAQMAQELDAARDQLAHAQKMELVGQLAGGVAHDFNNLLSVIMMSSRFIDVNLDEESELHQDAQRILQASESAASLVRRLLTFARQEVAARELVDPAKALRSVHSLLERSLPRSVSLEMDLGDEYGGRMRPIVIAPIELEQIVMNLGINARDAMPDGGELRICAEQVIKHPDDEVLPEQLEVGEYVRIQVSDTGLGMDERTRSRIFEPFFSTKPKSKGTGLGLSTVLNLIEQNNGFIRVESNPGSGSTFELYFPTAAEGLGAESSIADFEGDETVLVVDDDPEMRKLFRRILEPSGYTTLVAANADQALALLEESDGQVDLVLVDIVMPGIDGPTLVANARQRWPGLAALYTSGHVNNPSTRRTLSEQEIAFIAKPLTPEKLLSKIRKVLRTR